MADAISRVTSGRNIGPSACSMDPARERDGRPGAMLWRIRAVLVLPMGYARRISNIEPNFNSAGDEGVRPNRGADHPGQRGRQTSSAAPYEIEERRGGPVIVEIPSDMWNERCGALELHAGAAHPLWRRPRACQEAAALLTAAKRR